MKHLWFFTIAVLIFCVQAGAGEKPSLYLTGNRQVDFFGASNVTGFSTGPAPVLQELTEPVEKGEKSPWLAAGMSLIVPGTGEIYTENYLKGAVFMAAEAGFWLMAYLYDQKGDDQTTRYKNFANLHWSAERYAAWTIDHLGSLNPDIQTPRDEYYDLVFPNGYDPEDPCGPPFDCVAWGELNKLERDIASNGYTHALPYYAEQQYYELIGKYEQFSRGWDDSDPGSPLENYLPIRSTSARFFEYAKMRAEANNNYDVASTFVSVAVINHILSAADAFWSATRYNKALHAELRMRMAPTLYGYVPLTQANIKYEF